MSIIDLSPPTLAADSNRSSDAGRNIRAFSNNELQRSVISPPSKNFIQRGTQALIMRNRCLAKRFLWLEIFMITPPERAYYKG
jgi:hypothetical protein